MRKSLASTTRSLRPVSADSRFATNSARVAHRGELVAALESALAADDAAAWSTRLTAVQVPAGKVGTIADGFALAERLGLAPTVEVGPGHTRQVRQAITFSHGLVTSPTPAPALGADTDAVRAWLTDPSDKRLSTIHPNEEVHS